jgi:hypothetical protein
MQNCKIYEMITLWRGKGGKVDCMMALSLYEKLLPNHDGVIII